MSQLQGSDFRGCTEYSRSPDPWFQFDSWGEANWWVFKNLLPMFSQTVSFCQKLNVVSFTSPWHYWLQMFCSQLFSQYCCTAGHETAERGMAAFVVKLSRAASETKSCYRAAKGLWDFQGRSKSTFLEIPVSPTQRAIVCFPGRNENETLPPV